MDEFEQFVCELFRDDELAEALYLESVELNKRDPLIEPVDDYIERVWRQNHEKGRNPLRPYLPGN